MTIHQKCLPRGLPPLLFSFFFTKIQFVWHFVCPVTTSLKKQKIKNPKKKFGKASSVFAKIFLEDDGITVLWRRVIKLTFMDYFISFLVIKVKFDF